MKNKILFVISLLFGLMFINSGLNKVLHYMPNPEMPMGASLLMTAFAKSGWMMPLLAVVEIIGGVLFILPKTRALGAIMLLPVTVGIFLFHTINAPDGLVIGLVFLLINVYIIVENRNKYMPMLSA